MNLMISKGVLNKLVLYIINYYVTLLASFLSLLTVLQKPQNTVSFPMSKTNLNIIAPYYNISRIQIKPHEFPFFYFFNKINLLIDMRQQN